MANALEFVNNLENGIETILKRIWNKFKWRTKTKNNNSKSTL